MTSRTVYADIETGGLEETRPVIQLAAVVADDDTGEILEGFERKIRFDLAAADPKALELNHWTAEAWDGAELEAHVVDSFARFCARHAVLEMRSRAGRPYFVARMCCHNAEFDAPRMRLMFQRHGVFAPWDPRVRCSMKRALDFFDDRPQLTRPRDMKLATLCEYFEIPVDVTHDALADVRLCAALVRELRARALQAVA